MARTARVSIASGSPSTSQPGFFPKSRSPGCSLSPPPPPRLWHCHQSERPGERSPLPPARHCPPSSPRDGQRPTEDLDRPPPPGIRDWPRPERRAVRSDSFDQSRWSRHRLECCTHSQSVFDRQLPGDPASSSDWTSPGPQVRRRHRYRPPIQFQFETDHHSPKSLDNWPGAPDCAAPLAKPSMHFPTPFLRSES